MRVPCETCKGTRKIDIGGRKLDCNVCDEGAGPTGFVDDGRTPEEAAASAAKEPPAEPPTPNEQREELDLPPIEPVPTGSTFDTEPKPTLNLDKFIVIAANGKVTKSADKEAEIFDGLDASAEHQYVYQRIATVKPRTGSDIIKEND